MIAMPATATITPSHLRPETDSLRKRTENSVTKIGAVYVMATAWAMVVKLNAAMKQMKCSAAINPMRMNSGLSPRRGSSGWWLRRASSHTKPVATISRPAAITKGLSGAAHNVKTGLVAKNEVAATASQMPLRCAAGVSSGAVTSAPVVTGSVRQRRQQHGSQHHAEYDDH